MQPPGDDLARRGAELRARSVQACEAAAELIITSKQLASQTASLLDTMTRTCATVSRTASAQIRRTLTGPDLPFSADTLHHIRQTVLTHAVAAGLAELDASDVMLAVHELTANAVRHGGGTGRLRVSVRPGTLCYQIEDDGPASTPGRPGTGRVTTPDGISSGASSWPCQTGHGLWLVRKLASQMSVASGPHGSRVTVKFTLP